MIPFLVFGLWFVTRPQQIRFNFLTQKITLSGPGSISWGSPIVGGLTLHLDKKKKGWQSRICYNNLEFARSEFFQAKAAARDHFLSFAVALNYQLGSHSLKEFENNKGLSK